MSRAKLRTKVFGVAIFLLLIAALVTSHFRDSVQGRLRLPVGNRPPAISLGERHGLILASDGSLWSWGSDFLGWPVLGLGDVAMQSPRLRRIGNETNWESISVAMSHNLAIKSDGTIWTWGESMQAQGVRHQVVKSPIPAAPGNDWKQAAVGYVQAVALKKDGTLWAWGNNWSGAVGMASPVGSSTPVQVGSETNWIHVWAGILETVGMQSDHTLWYWGENPTPRFGQQQGQIFVPTLISPDTNWVDVGFGVNTEFAIKSDGTLWSWGRNAEAYTGAKDTDQDGMPARVGTDSDWRSISASSGWWCLGLTKKDGSLWLMDASEGKPNGPSTPYKPVLFRRAEFQKPYVAYAAGATHAVAPGVHGPIGVALTREGEVWTWGMVLGDSRLTQLFATIKQSDPPPVYRDKPWQLRNIDSAAQAK